MPKLRRREMFVKSLRARLSVHEYSKWRSPRIINMTGKQKMSTPSKLLFVLFVNFRKRKRSRATNNIPPDFSRFLQIRNKQFAREFQYHFSLQLDSRITCLCACNGSPNTSPLSP